MADPGSLEALFAEVSIPQRAGRIDERYPVEGAWDGVVVCISNLFAHIGVQINIAKIIEHLNVEHGFELVLVEGASGPGDTLLLAHLPYRVRWQFCDELLSHGYLTGAEYVAGTRPQLGIQLGGVDDPKLYRRQWAAARENLPRKRRARELTDSFRQALLLICGPVVRPELRELVAERPSAPDRADAHTALQKLVEYAGIVGVAPSERSRRLLDDYDALVDEVARRGLFDDDEPGVPAPTDFPSTLGWSRLAADRWLEQLRSGTSELPQRTSAAPEGTLSIIASLEEEWTSLYGAIVAALAATEFDLAFVHLLHLADELHEALQLRLQPLAALAFFSRTKEDLIAGIRQASHSVRRASSLREHAIAQLPDAGLLEQAVEQAWDAAETYYQTAKARTSAISDHTAEYMQSAGINRAIVVTGGFHTTDCAMSLRARYDFGVVTVTTAVPGSPDEGDTNYERRLREAE